MATLALPSPKILTSSQFDAQRWYSFYAMFSEEFARRAVAEADLKPGSVVLDPWAGVGTSVAVAAQAGHRAIGIDINPVMASISAGRCATRDLAPEFLAQVSRKVEGRRTLAIDPSDPLLDWFTLETVRRIRQWVDAIPNSISEPAGLHLRGFALTSIFEVAKKLAASYRSKNPTWIKTPAPCDRVGTTTRQFDRLVMAVANKKLELLPQALAFPPTITIGTSRNIRVASRSVDFVLTSPPYCTRIDYAMSTRLELAILGGAQQRLDELRADTMGSSTIRKSTAQSVTGWGDSCIDFLKAVENHTSKGSASYYLKTFSQYFDDLYSSMSEINQCLRIGACAVLVVQDSYYKGVHIDLPAICEEMGNGLRWNLDSRQDHVITRSMRDVNTRSRRYGAGKLAETVLWFRKSSSKARG